ncbi:MAG TPA: hypothetical protein DCO67_03545 [Staphylococcus sp.]|uniref:DUF771 domain-containing protein n=1 Tax=Mammaliicoccus fleurettii TaxID=150056 RepID=UPI000EDA7D3C|nr:DUF771 domain-containing protein [Mammaliicoccus fleurettii]MEB7805402.1 DUF771 domain-containing protein [Mammaliicoccus fleurettii]HAL09027.1 hypothetical protein [Staphylococcus sp.]
MQQLNATINIPADFILITKIEYEQLLNNHTEGKFISLKGLANHLDCSPQWLKENVLFNPRYKNDLKDFIHYPSSSGEKYHIHQSKAFKYFDTHGISIFDRKHK